MDSAAVRSLDGKTVIITGATSGIGKETAKQLAITGARVILAVRNIEKGEMTKNELLKDVANGNIKVKSLDLSSLQSVRDFAEDINKNEDRVDILVNNAGVFVSEKKMTEDGFETHFAVNHLGHFLLTYLLLGKLEASNPSRVVTVSSTGHRCYPLRLHDLQTNRKWSTLKAYGRSKTANILFSTHLARILKGRGVTSYCLHPGIVKTDLAREFEGTISVSCFNFFWKCFHGRLMTPSEGAKTTVYCCLEPTIAQHTGRYYSDSRETSSKSFAVDAKTAEKLWNVSCELCHLPSDPFLNNTSPPS